jgi:serine phosphatase RsbU (regulator of sigma subunit)
VTGQRGEPQGLGGPVKEVATTQLQPGDRVLFYTDGVTESRGTGGELFGMERLAQLFVRSSTEGQTEAETVRRLAATVLDYNSGPLRDDATFLMVQYHGRPTETAPA